MTSGGLQIINRQMKDIIKFYKKDLERAMNALPFVTWDRYSGGDEWVGIYGWINREKDNYKDFIVLSINKQGDLYYDTSSSKHSLEISELLGFDTDSHVDCIRVEDTFKVDNAIHS